MRAFNYSELSHLNAPESYMDSEMLPKIILREKNPKSNGTF